MRRNGYIVLLVAVAVVAVAVVIAACGSSSTHTNTSANASSPSCLPTTIEHSASLPGTDVDVSPEPGTDTANPDTQISFLGMDVSDIQDVSVTGSESGEHAGRVYAYSQGGGGSFVPKRPFIGGERVTVRALLGAGAATKRVSFAFNIDDPYPTADVAEFPNPEAAPADYQSFDTLPDVHPPVLSVTVPD
ncbi:MAG TPA: hypothetical protein VIH71_13980, partial [Solirubrobacteraceae bacterium]